MPTIPVSGAELYVKEAGSGPPLLLIHGSGINADTWGEIFDDLARDFRVVAYDRRGFSRSGGEATGDWTRHGADAAALIEALDMQPAAVVGWSAGGLVALDLAVSRPELVSSLVVLEAGLHGAKHPTPSFLRAWIAAQAIGRLRGPEAATDRFMRWTCGFRDGGTVWDEYPAERREVVRANGRSLLVELRARGKDNHLTAAKLGALPMPVTIAYGERTQDWFEVCSKAAAKLIPHARLQVIPGANHALGYTAPEAAARLIREGVSTAVPATGRSG